jgi:hypothetical protein
MLILLALAAAMAVGMESVQGQRRLTSAALKAGFTHKFLRFTTWPEHAFAGPQSPVTLVVFGDEQVRATLQAIARREAVDNRPLRVLGAWPENEQVHAVLILGTRRDRIDAALNLARGGPVLTIGDGDGFARAGGMLELVEEDQRITFDANLAPMRESGVVVSSKVLKLARNVFGRER